MTTAHISQLKVWRSQDNAPSDGNIKNDFTSEDESTVELESDHAEEEKKTQGTGRCHRSRRAPIKLNEYVLQVFIYIHVLIFFVLRCCYPRGQKFLQWLFFFLFQFGLARTLSRQDDRNVV